MTTIGDLRDLVEIHQATTTGDGAGGVERSWAKVSDEWAQAKTIQGTVRFQGDGLKEVEASIFVVRTGTAARQGDRLVWRGVSHDVEAVTPVEGAPRFVAVRCRVRQGGEP